MKNLGLVMILCCFAVPVQAQTITPAETASETVNQFREILDFCKADPDLVDAAEQARSRLDDIESLLAQALTIASDNRLTLTSVEPCGPVRTVRTLHGTELVDTTVQDQWKLTFSITPGPARLDDGLADREWFNTRSQAIEFFEGALVAKSAELDRRDRLDPTGTATLGTLYELTNRFHCETGLAFVILWMAGHPDAPGRLVIPNDALPKTMDIIDHYSIALASDLHRSLSQSQTATKQ